MANVNSIVGRFDGVLSYSDGSWSSFHAQIEVLDGIVPNSENPDIWSVHTEQSKSAINDIKEANLPVNAVFQAAPFITSFSFDENAASTKTVNSSVLHLYLLMTTDDGKTQPLSVTYERVGKSMTTTNHSSAFADLINSTSNAAGVLTAIKAMCDKIMTNTVVA